jgi:hypothetical protein
VVRVVMVVMVVAVVSGGSAEAGSPPFRPRFVRSFTESVAHVYLLAVFYSPGRKRACPVVVVRVVMVVMVVAVVSGESSR